MKTVDMDKVGVLVGDIVTVSAPSVDDLWENEFTGTVVRIKSSNFKVFIVVEDQDGDCFDVECEKVSVD